jgi:predicted CoA-substrate-specific enzyme activase
VELFLGLDVGSVSTNLAVLNRDGTILSTEYLRTRGDPRQAVLAALAVTRSKLGDLRGADGKIAVRGVGTTGSARRFAGVLVGADLVKNEIIAHATAAIDAYPDVSTILEIGGQDSKMIIVRDGIVVDFAMNTVCAAGTGSFLDQQAFRLGISIEQFGDYAARSRNKVSIASKCTVFAESDMIHKAQHGTPKEDIIAGLCEGIVRNYLSNVGKGKRIEDRIVFQGGVSHNRGVAAAFSRQLGMEITIPDYPGEMGAVGIALLARRHILRRGVPTSFLGFDLEEIEFETRIFECGHCPNLCEVVELRREGAVVDRYGHRCTRWNLLVETPSNFDGPPGLP